MMPRTTVDLDASVLREVKRLARRTKRSLGDVMSELLAAALHRSESPERPLAWTSAPMEARVDLADKEAVYGVLDGEAR
jgi:hypothetical protein